MLNVLLVAATLLVFSPAMPPPPEMIRAPQAEVIGPNDAIGFDYSDADRVTYVVTHFEASWDGQSFTTISPVLAVLPDTPAGFTTYKNIPPFTSGNHTVVFRACRVEGCGGGSTPFRLRVSRRDR